MSGDLRRRLFEGVSDDRSGGDHPVDTLQLQWKRANLVGKVGHGACPNAPLRVGSATRAMEPPSEVVGGLETAAGILLKSKPAGIENADDSQCFGKVLQAVFELVLQEAGGVLPFAFQEDEVTAASQLDADIGDALPGAALGPGRQTTVAEHLGEEDVDALLTDGLWIGSHEAVFLYLLPAAYLSTTERLRETGRVCGERKWT